jgi:hypothetical protein
MSEYYYKPWVRAAPYYLGMLLGYSYLDWKERVPGFATTAGTWVKGSLPIRVLLYVVGVACINWIVWAVIPLQSVTPIPISLSGYE